MIHRLEIDTIIAQVTPWPVEERVALAYQILRDMGQKTFSLPACSAADAGAGTGDCRRNGDAT